MSLHGGSTSARSEGPRRGSEFVVTLPTERRTGLSILVVDDNHDSAESLAMLLRLMGNEAHTAHDGEHALEMADGLRPELILPDIGMPRLNGYDACRAIRARSWGSSTSIVALTGWGQEADKVRAREAGLDAHLVKPVDSTSLAQLLASVPLRTPPPTSHRRAPTRRTLDRPSRHSGC